MIKTNNTNLILAAALSFALTGLAGAAHAQEAQAADAPVAAAAEPVPDNVVAYNAALVSDYRFRGLSQTKKDPAVQGGVDYTHNPTGLYAGTWLSTISWTNDAGGDGHVEWDLYAGKRGEIAKDVTYDVGGLYYYYPSNGLSPNANTFEVYAQLGFGPFYMKYSHSLTNLFGFADSKHSGYADVGANFEITDGYMLNLHVGHQNVKGLSEASYTDYKLGVTKDFGVVSVSLAAIFADTDAYYYKNKNLGKSTAVLTVSKSF